MTSSRPRTRLAPRTGTDQHDHDAAAIFTALATTNVPLTTDTLATTSPGRSTGPPTLCSTPPPTRTSAAPSPSAAAAWTVSARRDILTTQQHDDLADVAQFHHRLTAGEATTLLAAHVFGTSTDINLSLAQTSSTCPNR